MSCGGSHDGNANAAVISDTVKDVNQQIATQTATDRLDTHLTSVATTQHTPAAATATPAGPSPTLNLNRFQLNDDYPYPKVNNLNKMLQALEAVDGGACTDEAIMEAIGSVSEREGAYHSTNLGYLGFATASQPMSGGPREWMLTPQGVRMLEGTPADRVAILEHLIGQFPDASEARQADGSAYAAATINRRAASVPAWEKEIEKAKNGGSAFHTAAAAAVQGRMAKALAVVEEQRKRNAPPPPPAVCQKHFITLPASGICDQCDD